MDTADDNTDAAETVGVDRADDNPAVEGDNCRQRDEAAWGEGARFGNCLGDTADRELAPGEAWAAGKGEEEVERNREVGVRGEWGECVEEERREWGACAVLQLGAFPLEAWHLYRNIVKIKF